MRVFLLGLTLVLAAAPARASFLSGETLDTVADVLAIFVLFLVPVGHAQLGDHVVQLVFAYYSQNLYVTLRVAREASRQHRKGRGRRGPR